MMDTPLAITAKKDAMPDSERNKAVTSPRIVWQFSYFSATSLHAISPSLAARRRGLCYEAIETKLLEKMKQKFVTE